ncbi:MAG: hypothetical protein ACOCRK_11700 [bacterium]
MFVFNNREIAIGLWLLVIFILMIRKKNIRNFLKGLLKRLFNIKILVSILLMFMSTIIIVLLLYYINFWDSSLLKDTIIWFLFIGIVTCVNTLASRRDEDELKKIIYDNLRVLILIEFIINYYTFSLIIELIIMPFITLIFLLEILVEKEEKYLSVKKLLKTVQTVIGFFLIFYFISNLVSSYQSFISYKTLKSFLLPIILSLFYLPFIYLFFLYSKYEMVFVRLQMGSLKSKELINYAKIEIIKTCIFDLNKVKKLLNDNISNLMHIQNKEDVDKLIDHL